MTPTQRGPRVTPWAAALARSTFAPGAPPDLDVLDLSYGYPDPATYPAEELRVAQERVFARGNAVARGLSYAPPLGPRGLVDRLRSGLWGDMGNGGSTLLTNGSMEALDLLVRGLIRPGDIVVVELPTFLGLLPILRAAGALVHGVPSTASGMDLDLLERTIEYIRYGGRTVRFVYVMPTHANPTGSVMPVTARQRLAEFAEHYGFTVVEDDAYRELHHEAWRPPPTIHSLLPDQTFHLRTLSKLLAPGLRLGAVTGPSPAVQILASMKPAGGTSPLTAEVVTELLETLDVDRHIQARAVTYRQKRDALLTTMKAELPEGAQWDEPSGGFFVWVRLPHGVQPEVLASEARRIGVAYLAGEAFQVESGRAAVRLSFSYLAPDLLAEAAVRFGGALRASLPATALR